MKKAEYFLAFGLLILFSFLMAGCRSSSGSYYQYEGSVSVQLGMGLESYGIEGEALPIHIHAEGELASMAKTARLTVPEGESEYYSVCIPLDSSMSQDAWLALRVAADSSQLLLELQDEEGNVIYNRYCSYQLRDSWNQVSAGFFPGSVSDHWPDAARIGQNEYEVRRTALLEGNVSTAPGAYRMFDIVVLTAESYAALGEAFREALLDYAGEGGILLVESAGPDFALPEGTREQSGISPVQDSDFSRSLLGAGEIWVSPLSADEALLAMSAYQRQRFIGSTQDVRTAAKMVNVSPDNFHEGEMIWLIQSLKANTADPEIQLYIFLLGLYVLVCIPGTYFLLQRAGKLRNFGRDVCLLALVFFTLMYLIGAKSRISSPFIQNISLESLAGGKARKTECFAIQAPYSSDFSLTVSGEELWPLFQVEGWNAANTDFSRRSVSIAWEEEKLTLDFSSQVAFSPRYFRLGNTWTEQQEDRGVRLREDEEGNTFLVNETGYDLDTLMLAVGEDVWLIPALKEGMSAALERNETDSGTIFLTREQFAGGGYQNRGEWRTSYGSLYLDVLLRAEGGPTQPILVAHRENEEQSAALGDEYKIIQESFVLALVD